MFSSRRSVSDTLNLLGHHCKHLDVLHLPLIRQFSMGSMVVLV
jgi:hypothetical protein